MICYRMSALQLSHVHRLISACQQAVMELHDIIYVPFKQAHNAARLICGVSVGHFLIQTVGSDTVMLFFSFMQHKSTEMSSSSLWFSSPFIKDDGSSPAYDVSWETNGKYMGNKDL